MVRNLTTLVLSGARGLIAMSGEASACHKKRCACPPPVPCTVTYVPPAPCYTKVAKTCAPKVKHCGFSMPKFGHKKVATCTTPVYYAAAAPMTSPQASPQK